MTCVLFGRVSAGSGRVDAVRADVPAGVRAGVYARETVARWMSDGVSISDVLDGAAAYGVAFDGIGSFLAAPDDCKAVTSALHEDCWFYAN